MAGIETKPVAGLHSKILDVTPGPIFLHFHVVFRKIWPDNRSEPPWNGCPLTNHGYAPENKYQGVKEFHMLARIGCYCNIMVFSPFKVKVTYYHPLNQWLLGITNGNQGQTVMHLQCSETINHS